MLRKHLLYILKVAIIAIIYFFAARFGLGFDPVSGFATLVWPPTGIAIAAIILLGIEFWPGVFLGAFFANWATGAVIPVAIGIGTGNMLEAVFATFFLRQFSGFKNAIQNTRHAVGFIFFGALVSTMVSATIGVTSLFLGGVVMDLSAYWATWQAWYVGDALGALILTPLILAWFNFFREQYTTKVKLGKLVEAGALVLVILTVSLLIFGRVIPDGARAAAITYILFVPVIWGALRFNTLGSVTASFILSAVAIWATSAGAGPFFHGNVSESLFYLQIFVGILSATALILATNVAERKVKEKLITEMNEKLEQRVIERTGELRRSEAKLAEYAKGLETMVADRTKELEEKVDDLEKLNKFMVGRELKMIELKEEVHNQHVKLEELREKLPVKKAKPALKN